MSFRFLTTVVLVVTVAAGSLTAQQPSDQAALAREAIADLKVGPADCPQWQVSPLRNNVVQSEKIPTTWDIESGENIVWSMPLGSETYGNPIVANGKVYVGTNNGSGYIKRYPSTTDLGVLLCFDEATGKFLWQHSSEKLPTGRVHDWPDQGICSAPLIDGDRLWFVSSRGEVLCLDTEGFLDGENDGPFTTEAELVAKDAEVVQEQEADVVWKLNMMKELNVSQHNMCSCSMTSAGDLLFVNTSNGVDEGHVNLPAEDAPSFLCLKRSTGEVLWTDNTPGANVLHGQWSSPAYAVLDGVAQVIFGSGDGWVYSFEAAGENGQPKMLWKFDCNPKKSRYKLGGSATRNHVIGTPVIYEGLVYVGVGEDPVHGEGEGHLWCIDPKGRGDISPTLVFNGADLDTPIAHKRLQACVEEEGDIERPNDNMHAVWHYEGNNIEEFESTMHRSCGSVAIKNDLLYIADFSGLFHCLDAKTGVAHWTHDMLAASWASPLIVNDRVYISNEDGAVYCFELSKEKKMLAENFVDTAVYTTPIVANEKLFIANRNRLFCIQEGAQSGDAETAGAGE